MVKELVLNFLQLTAMMATKMTMMDVAVLVRLICIGLAMEYLLIAPTLAEMELSINMPGSNATMGKRWRLMVQL